MSNSKRFQFTVNTAGTCFLCFKSFLNLKNNAVNDNYEVTVTEDNEQDTESHGKALSLQNVFRYLNINLTNVKSISKKLLPLINQTDFRVELCEDCGTIVNNLSEQWREMESLRMKIELNSMRIHEKLVKSSENAELVDHYLSKMNENTQAARHSRLVEELRGKLENKCVQKNKTSLPILKLNYLKENNTHNHHNTDNHHNYINEAASMINVGPSTASPSEEIAQCYKCSLSFKNSHDLRVHQEAQHPNEHLCSRCDSFFDNLHVLKEHISSCTGTVVSSRMPLEQRPYKCQTCHRRFKQREHLLEHQNRKNKCIPPTQSAASTIKISEAIKKRLQTHKFKCEFCSGRYKTNGELVNHQRIHTGERPYKCTHCPFSFKQLSHKLRHLRKQHKVIHIWNKGARKRSTNSGPLPLEEQQPERQQQRNNVTTINEIVTSVLNINITKPRQMLKQKFNCEFCGNSYKTSGELQNHLRIHTGERPFKCTHCPFSFKQLSNKLKHIKRKHNTTCQVRKWERKTDKADGYKDKHLTNSTSTSATEENNATVVYNVGSVKIEV